MSRLLRISAVLIAVCFAAVVYAQDFEAIKRAAEKGDAKAQFNLGNMYLEGRGVALNDAEAAKWFRSAAEQGVSEAQHNLGAMYFEGRGVTKNETEAVKWFRLAS
ncbi:MAG: sel1 repeat family protein [Syntrophorhabdaceae bacterium]|nr:sel1 repeat family protein [Syntrophorhabdaceae bacterium]